jgi:cytochrome c oxidase subunit 2
MKRIGWAIALAAAAMTPAAAVAPQTTAPATAEAAANTTTPAVQALPVTAPNPEIGEPKPGGISLQPQVTEIGREAASFTTTGYCCSAQ